MHFIIEQFSREKRWRVGRCERWLPFLRALGDTCSRTTKSYRPHRTQTNYGRQEDEITITIVSHSIIG